MCKVKLMQSSQPIEKSKQKLLRKDVPLDVAEEIIKGDNVSAIKKYKEITGCSLTEAEEYISNYF